MSGPTARYVGRFAPTPTGPLHLGSLATALASYLDARAARGRWLLRIDDLDTPRTVPGSADTILRTLEALGLEWDGSVVYQHDRVDSYRAALERLANQGGVYPCSCTRAEIAAESPPAIPRAGEELRYPGQCRDGPRHPGRTLAWRLRVEPSPLEFMDRIQGPQTHSVAHSVGDFVVKRRDGIYAYQLAVVCDDAHAGITHVVRGFDLLDNTPRQMLLQKALDVAAPAYAHIPLLTDELGEKLSKSRGAGAVAADRPAAQLVRVLALLRQQPPRGLARTTPADVLRWAVEHWSIEPLRGRTRIQLGSE
jgi:glutamyl-Q tRNA(Asp) synthetase